MSFIFLSHFKGNRLRVPIFAVGGRGGEGRLSHICDSKYVYVPDVNYYICICIVYVYKFKIVSSIVYDECIAYKL